MLEGYNWTSVARQRIAILAKYEPLQLFFLKRLCASISAAVFIDIGANIGAYSIVISSVENIREIHAFEADPGTFNELVANVGLNQPGEKITVHPVALSDKSGAVSFGIVSEYSGANSIVDTSIHRAETFVRRLDVKCTALDSVLNTEGEVVVLKIDVEGHEYQVLLGAERMLTENVALIQIENYSAENDRLNTLLSSYGYRKLLDIGPDQYFTNSAISEATLVAAFSAAATDMIADNFTSSSRLGDHTARLKLPFGSTIEFSGTAAKALRSLKSAMRRGKR